MGQMRQVMKGINKKRTFWSSSRKWLPVILVGIIVGLISNFAFGKIESAFQKKPFRSDTELIDYIKKELSADGRDFVLDRLDSADLHGFGSKSLLVAGHIIIKRPKPNYPDIDCAEFAIFDVVESKYRKTFVMSGDASNEEKVLDSLLPRSVTWDIKDLNLDGMNEVITKWSDNSVSGCEQYVGLVLWDREYKAMWTPRATLIKSSLTTMKPWHGTMGVIIDQNEKQKRYAIGNTTHIDYFDLHGDGSTEILTADMIWEMGEAHFGDHRFVIRAYFLDQTGHIRVDTWNKGEPLVTVNKYPGFDFKFTQEIIDAGWQH